ncbi:L-serine ammonia-lyase [Candidatus Protochlamydia phocaeensis]|uniref:L-serine ammonia-lyase n=1 Tax=Candidatus Protochlamydia phocaeensis TaxID=1414722 RepID=UPI000838DB3B|nr:L-serine ammonia-lyase [Candidatus Protochlamydia phocaeensis]
MAVSVFNLFSIGIGPSSSHTVGPMRAARQFVLNLSQKDLLPTVKRIKAELYGSLALTGKGHSTDIAVLLGLEGNAPEGTDPADVEPRIASIRKQKKLILLNTHAISFDEPADLIFHYDKQLPYHPNGMRFTVYDQGGKELYQQVFYSVGGGFIVDHEAAMKDKEIFQNSHRLPYPFKTAEELLIQCRRQGMTIAQLMMENEKSWRTEEEIRKGLLHIWHIMQECVKRGCQQEGILPGGLNVKRRAAGIYRYLQEQEKKPLEQRDPAEVMDWVSLWALAVNEENAAGGRVVTAPTNGASGVIPAVLHYYQKFVKGANEDGIVTFLLVAGAIGILYKEGASISAAEMGCMGEVGVACSMAASGLAAALGGSNEQVENAAEIGMEHNLGLTCDPIKGLVQIPCIERNTMGAAKAINAERLARLHGDGTHRVTLDQVIATMRQTGHDMMAIYKETSQGGLAVNVPEC